MPETHIPNNNNVLLDKETAMLFPVGKEQNMILVQASGLSHVGKVRKANEDNFLINKPLNLFLVADGMGGHRGGGVASRIAVKVINAYLAAKLADRSDSETTDTADNPSHASMRLHQSITLANQKIHERSAADETCRGMGTTVSALYISGNTLVTANVGDSPIYLLRDGEIQDLYTPHTLLHEGNSKALKSRYPSSKLAHILTRAVGVKPSVKVDLDETPGMDGDIVVICSDGVSGKISKEEIRDIVNQEPADAACETLVNLANQRGGEDNSTIIVAHVKKMNDTTAETFLQRLLSIPSWFESLFSHKKHA